MSEIIKEAQKIVVLLTLTSALARKMDLVIKAYFAAVNKQHVKSALGAEKRITELVLEYYRTTVSAEELKEIREIAHYQLADLYVSAGKPSLSKEEIQYVKDVKKLLANAILSNNEELQQQLLTGMKEFFGM